MRTYNNLTDGTLEGNDLRNNLIHPSPGFVDPESKNYQLAGWSPAIDRGMFIPGFTDSYSGASPDIGAYEAGIPWTAGADLNVEPPVLPDSSPAPAPPPGPPPGPVARSACGPAGFNVFTGCYFNNADFTDFVVTRTDPYVNFVWEDGSPDYRIAADSFSAIWQGDFSFGEGNHLFSLTVGDGGKLFVDGVLLIDRWYDQTATTYTAARYLSAGVHSIRLEYYENKGRATAQLSWNHH